REKKKVKRSDFHIKNKKHRNSLKIMNFCVFISGLKIEFFPRHLFLFDRTILKFSVFLLIARLL
ncbi:hypothetical protein, partial [Lactobacillus crispatus]|uniref:hypothetical protein n=1 Tax=Lactobacillus crispatus TaxID=47770 RepID=UPI001E61A60E